MIVLGVISNIILVGNLQEANRQAEHKIAKLESEKKQKQKELEQQEELHKALLQQTLRIGQNLHFFLYES